MSDNAAIILWSSVVLQLPKILSSKLQGSFTLTMFQRIEPVHGEVITTNVLAPMS